jgi:serine/threonine-protein kinase
MSLFSPEPNFPKEGVPPEVITISQAAWLRTVSKEDSTREDLENHLPDIPSHRVLRVLGRGGMGVVYEARTSLDVPVALKVIRPDRQLIGNEVFLTRFRQEARAMQESHHPHILRIYHYDVVEGFPYFTMHLVEGGNLHESLAEYHNQPIKTVELMLKIVDAVAYLHENKKLHRDLKPQNILLDKKGEPYLTDFGLVKEFDPSEIRTTDFEVPDDRLATPAVSTDGFPQMEETKLSPRLRAGLDYSLTHTGAQLGTRPYMSPEQIDGRKDDFGPGIDVWALGVILYEMLTQRRPFQGPSITTLEDSIRSSNPQPPLEIDQSQNEGLNQIIAKCLSKKVSERFQSARELHASLLDWHRWMTQPASPQRRTGFRWLLLGVLLLGIGGALFLSSQSTDQPPVPPDPLAEIRTELEKQRTVVLIDGNQPRWFEKFGRSGKWHDPEDGAIAFSSEGGSVYVDLARGLAGGYLYRVELQPLERKGDFGVFVGRKEFTVEDDPIHLLIGGQVSFAGNKEMLTLKLASGRLGKKDAFDPFNLPGPIAPATPSQPKADGFYVFTFEVVPQSISFWVNDAEKPHHKSLRNQLPPIVAQFNRFRPGWGHITPTFDPSDGLGFYVRNGGGVRIRRAILEAR